MNRPLQGLLPEKSLWSGQTVTLVIPLELMAPDLDAEKQSRLDQLLEPAAAALQSGQLVAFPTETVYGLGANALDPQAVARIFATKGRPGDNPLIVHVADIAAAADLTPELSPLAVTLFSAFAPGPLTLILPRSPRIPDAVTAGLDTVAVRIPDHPVARRLIALAGVPVAAPSANRSGRPSPTRAWHVLEDFDGQIPFVIDGGACEYGLESTVLDLTGNEPVILRPGAISAEDIWRELKQTNLIPDHASKGSKVSMAGNTDSPSSGLSPRSPGMKYRHYAPKARLVVVEGQDPISRAAEIAEQCAASSGQAMGIYLCRQTLETLPESLQGQCRDGSVNCRVYAADPQPAKAAHHLFDALRSFDRQGVGLIIAEGLPAVGTGTAYMNRLRKAAGGGQQPNPDELLPMEE